MWLVAMALGADDIPSQETDEASLRRVAAGDGGGLAELYDRHGRAVYSLALRILGDTTESEEVVQDVFVQAWRQAARYDTTRGPVVAWLLMVTRSRAIDRLRRRRGLLPVHGDGGSAAEGLADTAAPVDWQLLSAEQVRAVRTALEELPDPQRAAIELAFYEGLTHTEVAERLEQPLGTIKTRIRLGLLRLRAAIAEARP
jgi:RNA polymerase sigma-70 factor (ECF subfamily)